MLIPLAHYALSHNTLLSSHTVERDFQSAIKFAFQPHHGPVYGCGCSPFHRNLFLTASTDMSARLYTLLDVSTIPSFLPPLIPIPWPPCFSLSSPSPMQSSPLLCVEPGCGYLFCLQWSPTRPLVFALGSADGQVIIYDLKVCVYSTLRVDSFIQIEAGVILIPYDMICIFCCCWIR